ncbi:membrane-bound metal-dependent hydrolase [Alicyclobacillus acidocaldarius subsp. acidocaldarius DSM 446]|uniref:Membrane-bound metal-dependent hydrolase n=2 Tax=Alicyclobacillus acidocaldarius TaxID=405212 RepID=C8WSW4_ALIAD|nr:membrane-bound metal-dependent hydrolase [Alicyclobacillus acidocaldarius subsp. acidocaldarius DSM 446]
MMHRTHQAAGVLAAAGFLMASHVPFISIPGVLGMAAGYFAAPLPDVDSPNSTPARMLPPLAWACELLRIPHRTLTHTVWAIGALFLLAWSFRHAHLGHADLGPVIMAAWIGVATHPLVDMLTRAGVPIFWPLGRRYPFRIAWFEADGIFDHIFHTLFLLGTLIVVVMWASETVPAMQHMLELLHRVVDAVKNARRV